MDDFCSVDPRRLIGMCMVPWEHPTDVLTALTQGLDEEVKHALLAGTAMKVYNLVDDAAEPGARPRETVALTS